MRRMHRANSSRNQNYRPERGEKAGPDRSHCFPIAKSDCEGANAKLVLPKKQARPPGGVAAEPIVARLVPSSSSARASRCRTLPCFVAASCQWLVNLLAEREERPGVVALAVRLSTISLASPEPLTLNPASPAWLCRLAAEASKPVGGSIATIDSNEKT